MTSLVIILCLVVIGSIISAGIYIQYGRYSNKYKTLARSLCDPDSWHISFHLRTLLLKGRVGGHPVRYAVFGEHRGDQPVSSYLLLEYPVKRNFRFYAASDAAQVDAEIRTDLENLQEMSDFCGLIVNSQDTPFLGKFLARPFGFGFSPGIMLWKWGKAAFDPNTVKKDFEVLLYLAKRGM